MNVLIDSELRWQRFEMEGSMIYYRGDSSLIKNVVCEIFSKSFDVAGRCLRSVLGHFALIIENDNFILASVDNCRSTPVFYTNELVSNSAKLVQNTSGLVELDEEAVTEVAMSGFVVGGGTVISGLNQLQAGEFLFWAKGDESLITSFFYEFKPDIFINYDDVFVHKIDDVLNNVMSRVIEQIDNRPVWVPLSGGLDSRLILCKLVELGCPNVHAFSYGPEYNDEAKSACAVSEILDVPWYFLPSHKKDMRMLFASKMRTDLWSFSNGLNGVPNFQDFLPLSQLINRRLIQKGDVVINGQSGDFITGGHIPISLLERNATVDDLIDSIIQKHFSLWNSMKTEDNLALIKSRIFDNLDLCEGDDLSSQELIEMYELSEYRERQSKFVVSGQRVYDFFELDWFLPLWDPEFVEIWRNIPAKTKAKQTIYKQYLETYNYKDMFANFTPCLDGWPGLSKSVLPFARIIRWCLGTEWRDRYLKAMAVFGMYGYFYAPYPLFRTILESQNIRNPISLFVRTWLLENNIRLPKDLK